MVRDFYKFEKLKHITVCYYDMVESVKLMVQEHYDTQEYDDTFFIINCNNTNLEMRDKFKRVIYYYLEHKMNDDYYNEAFRDNDIGLLKHLITLGVNEIWSMDYDSNFGRLAKTKFNLEVKYRPVRYTTLINPVNDIYNTPKTSDLCHIGVLTDYRCSVINTIYDNFNLIFKNITGSSKLSQLIPELNTAKYIIDTQRTTNHYTQNQVRIFELLCMGYTVIVQKWGVNLFPGLVYEVAYYDDIYNIIQRNEYLHPIEGYKELTYTDEAYEQYVNYLIKLQDGV